MELAHSRDGTPIAFWRSGAGPPLVLVHGATADHTTTWRLVEHLLAERFTICAMDRRGRGGSGDAAEYSLAREAEDVAAVVEVVGGNVAVLGHSYGALCALEAARITSGITRLILYEGVPRRGAEMFDGAFVERLDELQRQGRREEILLALYRDLVGMSDEELALMRANADAWAARLRNAPTVPREMRAEEQYVFVPERVAGVLADTLLLVGGESPPRELENARVVAAALPRARVVQLPGAQHVAMYTAPDRFVAAVAEFLSG